MEVLRERFWKFYWTALQRSGRDRDAREIALRLTFLLLRMIAGILLIFLFCVAGGIWGIAAVGLGLTIAAVAGLFVHRFHSHQNDSLNLFRAEARPQNQEMAGSSKVREHLDERALILASLLARAGSELHIQHGKEPPTGQVMTHEIQNFLLHQNGLWEKLEPEELELAEAPDGGWTVPQQNRVAVWCEQLRLLRWAIRIDPDLEPLAHFPKVDFSLADGLLQEKRVPLSNKRLLAAVDMFIQRDLARGYTDRAVTEFVSRGIVTSDPELGPRTERFKGMASSPSVDYLIGGRTIGELDDLSLKLFAVVAGTRGQYASYLAEQLTLAESKDC